MPIAAGLPLLIPMMLDIYSLNEKGTPTLIAQKMSQAVAAVAPLGLLPLGPAMIPMIPALMSVGQVIIEQALSFPLPIPDVVATLMAVGIAVICPMCPPSGLAGLQSTMKEVLGMGPTATPILMALKTANGIVTYFQSGGII